MNDIEMWGDWCSGWGPLWRQRHTIELQPHRAAALLARPVVDLHRPAFEFAPRLQARQ